MTRTIKRTGAHISKSPILKSGLVTLVVVLVLAGGYWRFIHKTVRVVHLPAQKTSTKSLASNTTVPATSDQKVIGGQSSSSSSSNSSAASLIAPSGSFVSNHYPNSTSDEEESLCSTSAGTMCYISFTKGTAVVQLESRKTDNTGFTSWTWKPSDLGLTSGSWTVSATASLSGKNQTTTDPRALEIP